MAIPITLRLLTRSIPFVIEYPFTAEHLREEIVCGSDLEWDLDGKGVEYLSLYNVEGRCLLDDDILREDEEYLVVIHTIPIQRYYLEDTDEVLELEIGENPAVDQVYDMLIQVLWEREVATKSTGDIGDIGHTGDIEKEKYLVLTLRVGGMSLLIWDKAESLTGREIAVVWREREYPWELE